MRFASGEMLKFKLGVPKPLLGLRLHPENLNPANTGGGKLTLKDIN
jgi:hypothetical protein